MSNPVNSKPNGVQDSFGSSSVSNITANQRVKTTYGPIGIITDVPQFAGTTVTGMWTVGASRVKVNSLPIINTASVGVGLNAVPSSTGPLTVAQADNKVKGL